MAQLTTSQTSSPVMISKEMAQSKPYLMGEFNLANASTAALPGQKAARELLEKLPFPGNKDEPWRKTNIGKLPLTELVLAETLNIELSDTPQGITFLRLQEARETLPALLSEKLNSLISADRDKFAALATGYGQDGFVLVIPRGMQVEQPLKALVTIPENGTIQNSRILVIVEAGASAELQLTFAGQDGAQPAMSNSIVEISVADNARFHLVERQELGYNTWHFSHEKTSVGANAALDWVYFAFGTTLTKSFIDVALDGKNSEARLNGMAITNSGQHLDLDTQQDHNAPVTFSDLAFKTALLSTSRSVWQGMIYVDPAAVQTDGYQSSRNLLLDKRAHADAIPGLEIKTDDVRCSHGATISQIDAEQVFYLKSRGLSESAARELIVNGFFKEIVDKVRDEDLRVQLEDTIHEKLAME